VHSQTCRSTFLASLDSSTYWVSLVPVAHLPRPAPWHSYPPSELREAHVRYAASHRGWGSPSPAFQPPFRLPAPPGSDCDQNFYLRWRSIRGTRWAWSLQRSTGVVSFCDLRTGLDMGEWSAEGRVTDALIESRAPNHWVLCHWKISGYVPLVNHILTSTKASHRTGFEIVATSVTLEQKCLNSPIMLSFSTIQRTLLEKDTSLSYSSNSSMMVWRDYLIGPYRRARNKLTYGLLLWSLRENVISYFEVCNSFFRDLDALEMIRRQMTSIPRSIKVRDDILFVKINEITGSHETYRCIHLPTLVISTRLPGGSIDLTEDAFAALLPECKMEARSTGSIGSVHEDIYSIPSCLPEHPRYCFIFSRFLERYIEMDWEILEVEVDLSIPGPIKIFSRVSRQYTVPRPTYFFHDGDDDLLLSLPSKSGYIPRAPLSVRFLRVGEPDDWRVAKLGGVDKMRLSGLHVDRGAGYIIA
jgi:hypothetical protein